MSDVKIRIIVEGKNDKIFFKLLIKNIIKENVELVTPNENEDKKTKRKK